MDKEQIKIFNSWIAPVTRNHIRDTIYTFHKNTGWTYKYGGSALDIGCGDGSATVKVLKEYLPDSTELWASDKSHDMIEIANSKYRSSGVKFIVSDVLDDEPMFRGQFDYVFSFYCLHYVTEQRKALENICNMLKSNGRCLLSCLAQNNFYVAFESLAQTKRWAKYMLNVERWRPPFHGVQDVELLYTNWLYESGFTQITVKEETRKIVYGSWNKFEGLMKYANAYYWKIPEYLRQEYMCDYKEEVLKLGLVRELFNKCGDFVGIEETYYNLVAYAVKI